jgi:hypothetical protein
MALCSYIYERPAHKRFRWWHGWAVRSRLEPMIEVARMLKRHVECAYSSLPSFPSLTSSFIALDTLFMALEGIMA